MRGQENVESLQHEMHAMWVAGICTLMAVRMLQTSDNCTAAAPPTNVLQSLASESALKHCFLILGEVQSCTTMREGLMPSKKSSKLLPTRCTPTNFVGEDVHSMDPCDTSTDFPHACKSLEEESVMDASQPAANPCDLAQFLMPHKMWARGTNGWGALTSKWMAT